MKFPRIKICGIKTIDTAMIATEYGVNAIGFVFYEKSPRYIDINNAYNIIKNLPTFVNKVGVFVDKNISEIINIIENTGIDTIQLHGNPLFYNQEFVDNLKEKTKLPIIYALQIEKLDENLLSKITINNVNNYLVDYKDQNYFGGTGKSIFIESIQNTELKKFINEKVILAGGISIDNIEIILDKINPYGIDLSSSLEIQKGIKDPELIKSFLLKFYKIIYNKYL